MKKEIIVRLSKSFEEAMLLKREYMDKNPDDFFLELISRLDLTITQDSSASGDI